MIWYSYKGIPYKGTAPAYYDLSDAPWFAPIKTDLEKIQQLSLQYLNQEGIKVDRYFNTALVEGKQNWKVSPFLFWGKRNEQNILKGNELFNCFKNISGLTGLALSILPTNTSVKPHYGDTDAVYRIHIPIKIPATLPTCGLKVNGIEKSWNEKEPITFCDAHLHEAWNHSDEVRIVLIADVVREEFKTETKNICLNVLSLLQLQKLSAEYKVIQALPPLLKGVLRILLKTILSVQTTFTV